MEGALDDEKTFAETASFVRTCGDNKAANNQITALLSPHVPYTCSLPSIEKIMEKAHKLIYSIHTHLAEIRDEIRMMEEQYGGTPIALMEKISL